MNPLDVRPYQLMCIICRLGEGLKDDLRDPRLDGILRACRESPSRPMRLRCNVDSTYGWQNPGRADDTPDGDLFNVKRDLEILMRLGFTPGYTACVSDIVRRLYREIKTCRGICDYDGPPSPHWRACPRAASGHYERGVKKGVSAFLPDRDPAEMARVKQVSADEILRAGVLRIRPHHLMCMTCFYHRCLTGRYGEPKGLKPIAADNLYEPILAIHRNPELPIMLLKGCCMVCTPCAEYDPATNRCLGHFGMSLRDERKDLEVLMRLGMNYGDTLPAREMLRRLYAAFPDTVHVCSNHGEAVRGPGWTTCGGAEGSADYGGGWRARLGVPGL